MPQSRGEFIAQTGSLDFKIRPSRENGKKEITPLIMIFAKRYLIR
jgi:hypothetical protein